MTASSQTGAEMPGDGKCFICGTEVWKPFAVCEVHYVILCHDCLPKHAKTKEHWLQVNIKP